MPGYNHPGAVCRAISSPLRLCPGLLPALLFVWSLTALAALTGCSREDSGGYTPQYSNTAPPVAERYVFGIHPLYNPQKLFEVFGPLVVYLNENLGIPKVKIVLEASSNYQAFNTKLERRALHFALPNPYQTVRAQKFGYRIFAKMDNDDDFRGVLILRKDSDIRTLADLKGKVISAPAPTALAATLMPQLFLSEHGLDVGRDIQTLYVGTHESTLMNVLLGRTAAASTWPLAWRMFSVERPEGAAQLEVRWRTNSLPSNGLIERDDVPPRLAQRVREIILDMEHTPQGRQILANIGIPRFVPADSATYEPVETFLRDFERRVRPLDF